MQVAEPTFPLAQPPTCSECGSPGYLEPATHHDNPIGNAGRPYYRCSCGKWITFDDNIGISAGNPRCYCRYICRLSNRRDGNGRFYSCPVGRCRFTRNGPPLPPQMTQMQTGANGIGGNISGSSVELNRSQGPFIQPVADYDMMDLD
ncbi:hypothetical protein K432DRAFT_328720 [Lepidopterella palustris CBS 459.81]|uniref:GRF-like zinc ribbon domain-containing protein n=1 Tax=Lepidopterella palustris CBS 459.81 TaxID=1314670 RepID=A0A8E2EAF8_9PEZI|nr:hypothetical protein K432DRAFT_328720 [Lepidopterella palustris CBS 459.81]